MAKKTYAELQKQIAHLNAEAQRVRKAEIAGVVARIKDAIKAYELTPQDLFETGSRGLGKGKSSAKSKAASGTPKFADGKGGTWAGMGPRPKWLRDALATGKTLSDFLVTSAAPKAQGKSTKAPKKAGRANRKAPVAVKYQDGAGNQWTGRGSQPRWLKAALAEGKTLTDLAV